MIAFLHEAGCDISLSVAPDGNQIGLTEFPRVWTQKLEYFLTFWSIETTLQFIFNN